MKQHPLKVYGLPDTAFEGLAAISAARYGKANISLFARDLLLAELEKTGNAEQPPEIPGMAEKKRLELRLPPHIASHITRSAAAARMSPGRYILALLANHTDGSPILTDAEVQALYQSNYQLSAIGRNINQIARKLNSFEAFGMSSGQFADWMCFIDRHTEQVRKVLLEQRIRSLKKQIRPDKVIISKN